MASKPLSVDLALTRAKSLARKGEVDEARRLYASVLERFPQNQRAIDGLRSLPGPVQGPRSAVAGQESLEAGLTTLAGLYGQGRPAEAYEFGAALAKRFPAVPQIPNIQGAALVVMGRLPDAIPFYEAAIKLAPAYAEAHHNLANALKALGRRGEAVSRYEEALRVNPGYAEAHRNLAAINTFASGEPQLARMEALAAGAGLSDRDRMHLGFALAKAYEDLGDAERSFRHVMDGNRLRKKERGYDIATDCRLFDELKRVFAPDAVCGVQPSQQPREIAKRPLFIVGMPRSGTTLVEQILASHSRVHGAGELAALNQIAGRALRDIREGHGGRLTAPLLDRVRVDYWAALDALGVQKPIVADKMPSNFRWIGFILLAMPEATIVHTRRDAIATCWSVLKTYFASSGNGFAYDIEDVAAYYKLYAGLMQFWH